MTPCLLVLKKAADGAMRGHLYKSARAMDRGAREEQPWAEAMSRQDLGAVVIEDGAADPDLDLCRRLRAARPDLPLFVATAGFTSSATRMACLEAGAAACLPLPFDGREVELLMGQSAGPCGRHLTEPRPDARASFSDRNATEERLRQSESTLRSFYESSSLLMGIVEIPPDHSDILHVYDNPATDRFFGKAPGLTAGRTARELGVPPEVMRIWLAHYRECDREGRPVDFEYHHVAGGQEFWLSVSVSRIGEAAGGGTRFSYVAQDVTAARRAARQLADSENRYRQLFESNPQPMWIFDQESLRFLSVNAAAVAHYGYSADEFLQMTIADIRPPEDVPALTAHVGANRRRGPSRDGSWRHVRKDGSVIEVEITSHAMSFEGRMARWVMVQDVTEKNRVLRMLSDSEERLEAALRAGKLGVFDFDPVDHSLTWDATVREIWGLAEGEPATEEAFAAGIHPEDRATVLSQVERALAPGERGAYAVDYRVINRRDGRERWVRAEGDALFEDGRATRFVGTIQDITERRLTEEALRQQQRLYKLITDNASLALFIMDEKQQCVFMNPAAEKLTGFSLAELSGRTLHDYIHHTHPDGTPYPLADCPIDQAFPKNDRESGEEVFVHKDGHFYDVRFTASPIRGPDGNPIGTVIEVEDVSERKRAERQIELLMREVNHRSKNMLAVVQAMASQTALRSDPQDFAATFTQRLHSLAASHDLLVHNNWRGVGLAELASSQLAHFETGSRQRIAFSGPDVHLTPPAAQAIGMALHELATNAAKYGALSGQQGSVSLVWSLSPPEAPSEVRLRWEEKGGPTVLPPRRKGFGSRLICEMTQLSINGQARLDYHPSGLVWEVTAPLNGLAGEGHVL